MILKTQIINPTEAGTIAAGAKAIGVTNTGSSDIRFDGTVIPVGVPTVNYVPVTGGEYPEIAYDPQDSSMLIVVIR